MQQYFIITICLIFFSDLTCAQKTTFIPCPIPPSLEFGQTISEKHALELFLILPYKIFPISYFERARAVARNEIVVTNNNGLFKVKTEGTSMTIIASTITQKPIVEVVYTRQFTGMIPQTFISTYLLEQKKNGWNITQTK